MDKLPSVALRPIANQIRFTIFFKMKLPIIIYSIYNENNKRFYRFGCRDLTPRSQHDIFI